MHSTIAKQKAFDQTKARLYPVITSILFMLYTKLRFSILKYHKTIKGKMFGREIRINFNDAINYPIILSPEFGNYSLFSY
jgi:hypothetical protein